MVICSIRCIDRSYLLKIKRYVNQNILTGQVKFLTLDSLFDRSFTILAAIELVNLLGVSAWISLQDDRTATEQVAVWMPPALIDLSLGCPKDSQQGQGGGHTLSLSAFMAMAASDAEVFFAAWDGALSCMKFVDAWHSSSFCTMQESGQLETPHTSQRWFSWL